MTRTIILLLVFIFTVSVFAVDFRVIERQEGRIRLHVTCEPPTVERPGTDGTPIVRLPAEGCSSFFDENGRLLPYRPILLQFPYRQAQIRLISVQEELLKAQVPVAAAERPLGSDSTDWSSASTALSAEAAVTLAFIGDLNGNRLWSANVFPFFYDDKTGELVFRREIVFDITSEGLPEQKLVPIPPAEEDLLRRLGAVSGRFKADVSGGKSLQKRGQETVERWKIMVNDEGLYRITGRDLQAAGVNLLSIDFKNLRLTCYGRDVSIYPSGWRDGQFDANDYFEFWGEPNRKTYQQQAPDLYRDPFSDERVYWLSWEKRGLWMAEESGQITNLQPGEYSRPYSYLETIHVEKDAYFERLSTLEEDRLRDHWFFDTGISAGKKIEYPFTLIHPDLQSPLGVRARVMLRGRTTSMDILHNISIFLNDSFLFSHTWRGQETADLESQPGAYVAASSLQNGVNRLSIVNNVPPQNYDFVMLNWFEITYPRLYRAYKNFIKFSIPPSSTGGRFLFRVDGFTESGIEIYKLYQSKINGGVIEQVTDFTGFTSIQISFQNDVFSPDIEFVAVTESAKKKPIKIIKDQPTLLKSDNLAADYLVISHRRFMQSKALEDLIAHRQSQGLTVLAVDAEDVYDEFNYGHISTFAIRDFIRHAYLNWQAPKLEYVLLVGDGSYVRRTAEGDTLDLVPVHMRQTMAFGAAASDYWYTLLTGDDEIPEIAVGRLPVRTVEELERFVGKIIRYEANPPVGDWANRFLIIGGNGDDFRSQGMALSKIMPPQINTRLLFSLRDRSAPFDPYFGGTTDLLDYFNKGCSVITFHGHGGGAIWADNGLLRVEDCRRIYARGKYPFIMSMTCFTGSFESPETESLADALLIERDEGAAAFLGASGVGWTWNDYFLQTELMKQIFNFPQVPLGKLVAAAKIAYLAHYQTSQAFSQVNQYHLLGDPAMRLHLPQGSTAVVLNQSIALPGDTLKVSSKSLFPIGFGLFDLEDSLRIPISTHLLDSADSLAQGRLIVKESFRGESGIVRFFAADELNRRLVNGAAPISLKGIVFDSAYVARAANDSLYFYARVRSRSELGQIWCYALNDSIPLVPLQNHWFKSARGIFIIWSGFQFSYYFKAADIQGQTITSRLYKYYISLNVDVEAAEGSVRYIGGEWVMLEASVLNKSGNPVSGLEVLYRCKSPTDSLWQTIGKDTISIEAYATGISRIRHAPSPGELWVEVVLDPDSLLREDTKENNRTAALLTPRFYQAMPQGFLLADGLRSELRLGQLAIELPAGALARPSALAVWPLETVTINQQPDFLHRRKTPAFHVELSTGAMLQRPAFLRLDTADSTVSDSARADWKLYRFTKQTKKWIRCDTRVEGNVLVAEERILGPLAVIEVRDDKPPQISIAVDGQPYVDYKWVGSEPRLGIRLQDENGIDLSPGRLMIALDNLPVDSTEIALPDSIIDGNQIVISYNPRLSPGDHVLAVQATDCNRNISEIREYYFRIAEELQIQMLGNYPNPFREETRFAYILTAPVDDLSLKIYTASGRLIRSIKPADIVDDPNPLSADYHEILWDGRDAEGYETANGVYFYRLTAKGGGRTRTITGKIAKIL